MKHVLQELTGRLVLPTEPHHSAHEFTCNRGRAEEPSGGAAEGALGGPHGGDTRVCGEERGGMHGLHRRPDPRVGHHPGRGARSWHLCKRAYIVITRVASSTRSACWASPRWRWCATYVSGLNTDTVEWTVKTNKSY
eukprot:1026983-Prorocentrum_minimum.AAC.1